MSDINFFTIGVYGMTEDEFFKKLLDNNIDTFCDIRRRRGVRGSKYIFVNSKRLQNKLKQLRIKYLHVSELAPTKEIREIQKKEDESQGISKRKREILGEPFIKAYKEKILNKFDLQEFISDLKKQGAKNVVLFCVEGNPLACHRSIVAEELSKLLNKPVKHL